MKKILICLLLTLFITMSVLLNVKVLAIGKEMNLDNVSTLNFKAKMGYLRLFDIKKMCSYDYCDYVRGDTFDETVEIFTRNYLRTIQDEDIKASLRVKGIKITKLIFEDKENSQ